MKIFSTIGVLALCATVSFGQQKLPANDVTTPLHLMKPDYPVPYGATTENEIKEVLDRIYLYLNAVTPPQLADGKSGKVIADLSNAGSTAVFKPGDFRLISYEWGVTYTGMLLATETTGDKKFSDYTVKRVNFIADVASRYRDVYEKDHKAVSPVKSVLEPRALDDAGAICAAMIKATHAGGMKADVRQVIDNYINYIMKKEFRLSDGTLARNRPQPNTLWLDDLYMSLPALVQMGKLTGDTKYYDEALMQFGLFSKRMFNAGKGLYMHGWVEGMEPHPEFRWARANGWALLTKIEMLDAIPEGYKGRAAILDEFKAHVAGLSVLQDGTGFWHQLLDKNDSYLETSATAIYTYCIAHGINKGWLDARSYGPVALSGWNAVRSKVNVKGQVEGTCVGTGMGFDAAFYYYRPVNSYAAHGYGPALLAGAEMYKLLQLHPYQINDSAVQFLH